MTRIEPLEITSLRGDEPDARARPARGFHARRRAIGALLAIAAVALAAACTRARRRDRSGPVRAPVLVVIAWSVGRGRRLGAPARRAAELDHGRGRDDRRLAALGAAEAGEPPRSLRRRPAVVRALAIAAAPRRRPAPRARSARRRARAPDAPPVVDDRRLRPRARRRRSACIADRPDVPIAPGSSASRPSAAAVIGSSGTCAAAAGRRTAGARARLQWVAWGRGHRGRDLARRGRAQRARRLADGTARGRGRRDPPRPALARARRAPDQLAVRIDRLLVHSITLRRPRRRSSARRSARDRARPRPLARRQREDAARPVDARGRGRRALLWVPARERLSDSPTRRVYGERSRARRGAAHVRQPPHPRAPARRAAPPARGVAQGDDEPRGRRGVDTSGGDGIERAVSVPDRGPAEHPARPRGGDRRRARRRVGPGVGAGVAPRAPAPALEATRAAHRAGHELRRAARADRRAARVRRTRLQRGRRPRAHASSPARSASRSTT